MLQYIKKYIKGWFLGIILFFIFISFTFWGVGDIFRSGSGEILKIGKNRISPNIFLNEFQSNINYLNKKNKNISRIELEQVANETLRNIANRNLIINGGDLIDIKISESVIKKNIYENEVFMNKLKDNSFDKNRYDNFVKSNFGSEKDYLNFLEHQIFIEIVSDYFEKKINYPENLVKKIYDKLEEKRTFEIASIDKNFYRSSTKEPLEESLRNYFANNKELYSFDERRSFSYIFQDLNKIKKKISVNEDEILESYNNQKEDFVTPEKRKVVQIVFNSEKDGKKVLSELDIKSDFKKISEKEDGFSYINLGFVEKEQLFDEFADQVFKIKEGNYTNLIKTDIGWHILKVTEIIESKTKNLNEVKKNITDEIRLNKSFDELDSLIVEVENIVSDGSSLEEISSKLNLNLEKKKLIERKFFFKSNLPQELKIDDFFNEVFDGKKDSDLFIQEIENGFFLLRVDEILEEAPMTYKEAYDNLVIDVKEKEIEKKIKEIINKFKTNIEKGSKFMDVSDSLNMNTRTTKKINREGLIDQGISIDMANEIFESKINTIHDDENNDKYHLIKVITDSEIDFNKERFEDIRKDLNKIYGIDNFNKITSILGDKFPVKINKKILNEFVDRFQY